jgi:hypothetical protein
MIEDEEYITALAAYDLLPEEDLILYRGETGNILTSDYDTVTILERRGILQRADSRYILTRRGQAYWQSLHKPTLLTNERVRGDTILLEFLLQDIPPDYLPPLLVHSNEHIRQLARHRVLRI